MLTAEEADHARRDGWELRDVFDLRTRRFYLVPMPVTFPTLSVRDAQAQVVRRARERDKVAIKALALISQSNLYQRKK